MTRSSERRGIAKLKLSEARTISLLRGLEGEDRTKAEGLLKQLRTEWPAFSTSRARVARTLFDLQTVFARAGRKGRFTYALNEFGIKRSTAYDLIKGYKAAIALPTPLLEAAAQARLDVTKPQVLKSIPEASKRTDVPAPEAQAVIAKLAQTRRRARKPAGSASTIDPQNPDLRVPAAGDVADNVRNRSTKAKAEPLVMELTKMGGHVASIYQVLDAVLAEVPDEDKVRALTEGVGYMFYALGDAPGDERKITVRPLPKDLLLAAGAQRTAAGDKEIMKGIANTPIGASLADEAVPGAVH